MTTAGGDLVPALRSGDVDAGRGRLGDDEVVGSIRQIFIAGHIAVAAGLGSAIRHLADDPALQGKLRAEPALVADAVEELLRLHTPNQGFARIGNPADASGATFAIADGHYKAWAAETQLEAFGYWGND